MSFAVKKDAGPKRSMGAAAPKPLSMTAHKRSLKKITSVVALQAAGKPSAANTTNRKKGVLQKAGSSSVVDGSRSVPNSRPGSPSGQPGGLKKANTEPQLLSHLMETSNNLVILDSKPVLMNGSRDRRNSNVTTIAGRQRKSRPVNDAISAEEVEEDETIKIVANETDIFSGSNRSLASSRATSEAGDDKEEEVFEEVESEADKLFRTEFLEAKFTDDMEREMWVGCWKSNGFDPAICPEWSPAIKQTLIDHTRELVRNHLSIAGCMGPAGLRKWSMSFLSRRKHKEITENAPKTEPSGVKKESSTSSIGSAGRASPVVMSSEEISSRGPTPQENMEAAMRLQKEALSSSRSNMLQMNASTGAILRPPSAGRELPSSPPQPMSANYVTSKIEKINIAHNLPSKTRPKSAAKSARGSPA